MERIHATVLFLVNLKDMWKGKKEFIERLEGTQIT
jgi:hypothetical protein